MSDYRVIVRTCDAYIDALKPFAWLFNKYWSNAQPVLVAGFTPPDFALPSNFEFMSLGTSEQSEARHWSDMTIKLLQAIPDDVFVFMMEDFWLINPVAIDGIDKCIEVARSNADILRIDITGERYRANLSAHHTVARFENEHIPLIKSYDGMPYQVALCATIYRRSQFLRLLEPQWTPWDVEIRGTNKYRELNPHSPIVLGVIKPLLDYCNGMKQDPRKFEQGLRGKDAVVMQPEGLQQKDYFELKELGLIQ